MSQDCSICSQLRDVEYASQKNGWPDDDTFLPQACGQLQLATMLSESSDRTRQLQQCPECGAYYLYETDYEFLANGTEDDQSLIRLSKEDAAPYLV